MTSPIRRESFKFAPGASPNSIRLRIASGYFILVGVVILINAAWLGLFAEADTARDPTIHAWQILVGLSILIIAALGLLWTGLLLRDRSRRGGILALVFLILPVVGDLLSRSTKMVSLVITAIGVAIIASVWKELS